MRQIDRTGIRYGRLVALRLNGKARCGRELLWECRCDCGLLVDVTGKDLSSGHTKSCGCLRVETSRDRGNDNRTHGATHSSTYRSWKSMRGRVLNPKDKDFSNYGGRGVSLCDRWHSFENFVADMGERPPGTSIDRIDPDGNYEPDNCRWASPLVQTHNRRASKKRQEKTP